ncbi:unnamed protein product [Paramecium pentaurelia]|uniref:Uncharacterized protein n=1 Tax=Paramecium pentaurelia TaxID=43138 RepID=A0A8S1YGD3_9CILI|nr:unnamed protein product [Paramecium pentaurelia]
MLYKEDLGLLIFYKGDFIPRDFPSSIVELNVPHQVQRKYYLQRSLQNFRSRNSKVVLQVCTISNKIAINLIYQKFTKKF